MFLSRIYLSREFVFESQSINHRRSRYLLIIMIQYRRVFQMTRLFRSFYFPPYTYIYI